jgi:hypothetical protein
LLPWYKIEHLRAFGPRLCNQGLTLELKTWERGWRRKMSVLAKKD